MARLAGFEPTTLAFGGQYSIQLSYKRTVGLAVPSSLRDRPFGRRSLALTEPTTLNDKRKIFFLIRYFWSKIKQ